MVHSFRNPCLHRPRVRTAAILGVLALALQPGQQHAQTTHRMSDPVTIGSATMTDDGSIVLNLRATGPGIGDAQITYAPDSPHYAEVLRHIGGLRPGQSKLVPPWPEQR
jgi:hypothetical protein